MLPHRTAPAKPLAVTPSLLPVLALCAGAVLVVGGCGAPAAPAGPATVEVTRIVQVVVTATPTPGQETQAPLPTSTPQPARIAQAFPAEQIVAALAPLQARVDAGHNTTRYVDPTAPDDTALEAGAIHLFIEAAHGEYRLGLRIRFMDGDAGARPILLRGGEHLLLLVPADDGPTQQDNESSYSMIDGGWAEVILTDAHRALLAAILHNPSDVLRFDGDPPLDLPLWQEQREAMQRVLASYEQIAGAPLALPTPQSVAELQAAIIGAWQDIQRPDVLEVYNADGVTVQVAPLGWLKGAYSFPEAGRLAVGFESGGASASTVSYIEIHGDLMFLPSPYDDAGEESWLYRRIKSEE